MKTKAILTAIVIAFLGFGSYTGADSGLSNDELVVVSWNVRGYPEKQQEHRTWFTNQLLKLSPDVICVQEIANRERVNSFLATEEGFTQAAFLNSSDGQDNAIFTSASVTIRDIPDPSGFQHPVQAAYISDKGFDAVIVTVHLSWTNVAMREQEKVLLNKVVSEMKRLDPDVIIAGDFNTKEKGIQALAKATGLKVMIPYGQDDVGTTHANNRYDYFLVTPDLAEEEAVSCRIETYSGNDLTKAKKTSDHLPVIARFRTDEKFMDRNSSTEGPFPSSEKNLLHVSQKPQEGKYKCGSKTKCGEMGSCEEAIFYLMECSLARLDRDKDGVPCEALCKKEENDDDSK